MHYLVGLERDEHARRDDCQVLGPAPAHRKADAFSAFEHRVGERADRQQGHVREVADHHEQTEEQLLEDRLVGVKVQLLLG